MAPLPLGSDLDTVRHSESLASNIVQPHNLPVEDQRCHLDLPEEVMCAQCPDQKPTMRRCGALSRHEPSIGF